MKMTVFWDTVPCSLVKTDRQIRGAYCLYHQCTETSVNFYQVTWLSIPVGTHLEIYKIKHSVVMNGEWEMVDLGGWYKDDSFLGYSTM
jgi:hypothetical protein